MTAIPHSRALYTVEQVRALDRWAIGTLRIEGLELMRRAAAAAFASLRRHWPQAASIAVYCGAGNNGGDGFLLGALALGAGFHVELRALVGARAGDAARAREIFVEAGGTVHPLDAPGWPAVDVRVDALYGTGLHRAPPPPVAALIERINADGAPVLALDVPSGLDADSGNCPGAAIRADVTVGFIAGKRGLHTGRAPGQVGVLELYTLGLQEADLRRQAQPDAHLLMPAALPRRARNAHKGDNGHVLAVGGEHGMAGAIRLCGEAAQRAGAGLVSVATRAEHLTALNAARPELMAHAVDGPQALEPLLARASVLALGPGLGQGAWGHALWLTALDAGKPLVLDADGLNLLAREPRRFGQPAVLTPHPGEAARLLGSTVAAIEADRFAAARELARRYDAVVVLKGAGSLIADPDGRLDVCPWGNPGMASGGMGDLLTGIVAALLAQGRSAWQAATLGVGLHARAGDLAAREGEIGMLASDLLAPLRELINGVAA
ncbi:carbohydrate kinase [Frateuria sp. Soil773]|uniref:bifunctional ADP-dependent NAD(P)H-hydrate dehydratase/NAD(P)H-hydrate epimerase n=1 Tax=Frateuria sp. Soil773 TaxID=1736407 RepID=UPI0006F83F8F|nr:bifunctional ADP-dependent NAD(P)H-hydrate dehydratase/NAD(P)H-hydrate epimerase [Frateuria sp. Soil773]KRE89630.1 carbohydrate kinase [Frateuria sp. Soil773]